MGGRIEDPERHFRECVPLDDIARQLGVGQAQFYHWVQSNGFEVIRIKGRATVRPETANAIVQEAKKQGFTNPTKVEEPVKPPPPRIESDERTLAYRAAHPVYVAPPKKPMVKLDPSPETPVNRRGWDGAIQPIEW